MAAAHTGGASASESRSAATPGSYPTVRPYRPFDFPRDHGAHPDFRVEWWYLTADLESDEGPIGVQITFFRVRTAYGENNPSRFAPTELLMAHAALVDTAQGRSRHAEQAYRTGTPIAACDAHDTRLAIGTAGRRWTLARSADDRYRCQVSDAREEHLFGFDIEMVAEAAPALQGDGGYMQKGPDPAFASYYYSRPQAQVQGAVRLDHRTRAVSGKGWLDHEWMSAPYAANSPGWDWMGLNLDNGEALTVYRIRSQSSEPVKRYAARFYPTEEQGARRYRSTITTEVTLAPLRHWRSPASGARYPVAFRLRLPGLDLAVLPRIDDAEFDASYSTNTIYWEGPVTAWPYAALRQGLEPPRHGRAGRGYMELTGYAGRVGF